MIRFLKIDLIDPIENATVMGLLFGNRLRGKIRLFFSAKAAQGYLCLLFFNTKLLT